MDRFNNFLIHNLTLLNWNANGLREKRSTFISFMARHNIDIACVTETHLVEGENFKISGYSMYREDRQGPIGSGGVAIFVKRSINHHHTYLPQFTTLEAVGVKIFLQNNTYFRLVSIYKSPNRRLHYQDLRILFPEDCSTVVIGDLNCKHRVWGCRTTNPNGNRLLQYTDEANIMVAARDEPTHHPWQYNYQPDILDIVLHRNFSAPIMQQVLPELDSDHSPVIVSFFTHPHISPLPPRLINGKVN